MRRDALNKDLIINQEILRRTAENLRTAHNMGVISDARWDEFKDLGRTLLEALGNDDQAVMSSSNPLTPHVLKAVGDLKTAGKEDALPEQIFIPEIINEEIS